jgi:hypothetical protein
MSAIAKDTKFHYMKRRDMLPSEEYYILPSRECAACKETIPEFWANSCPKCLTGMIDARIMYDASDMDATYMVITDPELIQRFSKENAWVCTAPMGNSGICGYVNDQDADCCSNPVCSEPRSDYGKDIPNQKINEFGTFQSASKIAGIADFLKTSNSKSVSMTVGGKMPKTGMTEVHSLFNGAIKIVVTLGAVGVIGFQGYQWFTPVTMSGNVASTHWETTVSIEKLTPVESSGWTAPSDAYSVTWTNKIQSYDTVNTGTTHSESVTRTRTVSDGYRSEDCSTTSGSLVIVKTCQVLKTKSESYQDTIQVPDTKQVPVEAKWYTYTQDKWLSETTLPMIGDNSPIKFADTILSSNERANESCSASLVTITNDGKTYNVSIDCSQLPSYQAGRDHIDFQHNKIGMNWGAVRTN